MSEARRLDAFLLCPEDERADYSSWSINPIEALKEVDQDGLVEDLLRGSFVFKSKLELVSGQYRAICPPIFKALCDEQGRIRVTRHSAGVALWSVHTFNEHHW